MRSSKERPPERDAIIRHVIESANTLVCQLERLGVSNDGVDGPESLARALSSADKADLIAMLDASAQLARVADAITARAAAEIGHRSTRDLDSPLAREYGERSGAALVSTRAKLPTATAAAFGRVGMGIRARTSLTGENLPALHPLIGAALDEGWIPMESARLALVCLDRAERHLTIEKLERLEAELVENAETFSIAEFRTFAEKAADIIDAEGVEPREALQRDLAGIRIINRRNGVTRAIVDMEPESAGFFRTAIANAIAPRPCLATEDGQFNDLAMADTRSLPQRRLDGLIGVLRQAISSDDSQIAGVDSTIMVVVGLKELTCGKGAAYIAGVDDPISISTVLRLAATAKIVPVVLSSDGEVLHYGRERRLFSRAQRRAMFAREGGCAFPGCDEPMSRLQAAHIRPWMLGGATDIENGLLLCAFHHRMFDLGGWDLIVRGGRRFLVPPPDIDPLQRPRPVADRRPSFAAYLDEPIPV